MVEVEVRLGKYRHFKGNDYEVLAVARDCDNPDKKIVVYRALYDSSEFGKDVIWYRSLEDFIGFKELESKTRVKRFEFLGGQDG